MPLPPAHCLPRDSEGAKVFDALDIDHFASLMPGDMTHKCYMFRCFFSRSQYVFKCKPPEYPYV